MGKKIAIVGAGAVGAHIAGYLTREGHDLTVIDIWPAHVEAMRTGGLTLEGMTEPECFTVKVNALHVTELQQLAKADPFDFAFICPKSYDTVWHTQMIAQYLAADGFCVSLQNSINEERIASVVGWGKVIGCIASTIAVDLDQPGHVYRNVALGGERHTIFRVGEPHGRITSRIQEVAEMLSVVDSSKTTTNLWGERWSKLCVNAMRNPVAAATGQSGNTNDRDPITRRLSINLAGEACKIGIAHGYNLENIYKMPPEQLIAAREGDEAAMEACGAVILENASFRNDDQRPSMGQDMLKGRRTEIDFISGLVVDKAEELGLEVPCNAGIVEAVKKVERGDIPAGRDAVAQIIP